MDADAWITIRRIDLAAGSDSTGEWERVDGEWRHDCWPDVPATTLTEALEFGNADRMEVWTDGVSTDEVLAALMPAEYLFDAEAVEIDGTLFGPFWGGTYGGGWFEVDLEYRKRGVHVPVHRLLAGFDVVDASEDMYRWTELVGEVRPGVLISYRCSTSTHWSRDEWEELVLCPPQELYLGHVRTLLFEHGVDLPELEEAIRRAVAGEGGAWRGDQLRADGQRALTIEVTLDPAVADVLRTDTPGTGVI